MSDIRRLTFHCVPCNGTFLLHNKFRHERSKTHEKKLLRYNKIISTEKRDIDDDKKVECQICTDEYNIKNFTSCKQCSNEWCSSCNKKIYKCPFCRKEILGRNHLKIKERREIEEENRRLLMIQLDLEIQEELQRNIEIERQRNLRVNNPNTFQSLIQGLFDLERRLVQYSRNVLQ